MSEADAKPAPTPRGEERTWFEAAAAGRLVIQQCAVCRAAVFFPRSVCPVCHDDALEWADAAGTGTVYSYTVLHRAGKPGWEADVPYLVALIELDEGPRLMGNLLDIDPDEVYVGMPVRVTFERRDDTLTVPQWVPA